MKILAINKFYHILGGTERYFFELNALHTQAGHTVVPFAMRHPMNLPCPYERYFVSYINFWNAHGWREKVKAAGRVLYSLEARHRIRELIEDTRPDIAHLHLIYHQISPSILPVIKQSGIPIVQTLHDYKPICPTYNLVAAGTICERCKGKRFYHATLQKCNHSSLSASLLSSLEMYLHYALKWYDLPDIYVTPSEFMRSKMIEFGMQPEKLVHIPNFVNTDEYTYSDVGDGYFLYVGRLVLIKGVETLLRAMHQIRSRQVKLLIVGAGPQQPELEALQRKLGLGNVEFLGHQPRDKLQALMANAMFSVTPSEWYENCPLSVLEAMAMGKPVIGARIGGIPELINHGVDGLLFEPGNAAELAEQIDTLATDRQLRRTMGMAAREKVVNKYSHKQHYQAIIELYRRVMQKD